MAGEIVMYGGISIGRRVVVQGAAFIDWHRQREAVNSLESALASLVGDRDLWLHVLCKMVVACFLHGLADQTPLGVSHR